MALVLRYNGIVTNPRGITTEIDIYQEGYTGDVQTVEVYKVTQNLARKDNTIYWGVAMDSVEVTILDIQKLTTFSTVFGIIGLAERNVQLILNNGSWKGWLKTKSITYDRYLPGTITLTFVSGISYLEQTPYLTGAGNRIRSRDTYIGIMAEILAESGQAAAGFNVASEWFTRFGASELTGTLPEPLFHFLIDREVFWDEDSKAEENGFKGLPIDMMTVLSQLAIGSLLRVFYWDQVWWIMQRRLTTHLSGEDTVQIWTYPSSLSGGFLDNFDHAVDIDLFLGGDIDTLKGVAVTIEDPIVATSITYFHRKQSFSLLGNPFFTDAIQETTGDAILNWKPSTADVQWVSAGGRGAVPYSPGGLRVPVQYYIDPAGFAAAGNAAAVKAAIIGQVPRHAKQIGAYVEGGDGRLLSFITYIRYYGDGTVGLTGDGYTVVRLKVGSYWVIRDSAGVFSFDATPTGNEEYLLFPLGQPGNSWLELVVPGVELFDGVTPISGNLEVYLHEITEDYNGTGTGRGSHGEWDDNISLMTTEDGTVFPEATQTTCADSSSNNTKSAGGNVVLFGSGPTQSHRSRLTSFNSAFSPVEITSNFQIGNDFSGAATTKSRDALWCDQLLRQTQVGLTRISATLDLSTGSYAPYQVLRDNIHAGIVTATSGQSSMVTNGALMPLRTVNVDGEMNRVTTVNLNANGTYTIGLETPLGSTHAGIGIIATQRIKYTWDSLSYDLIEQTVTGEWTELYDGAGGDPPAKTDILNAPSLGSIQASTGRTVTQIFNSDNLHTVDAVADLAAIVVGTEKSAVMVRAFSAATGLGGGLFVGDPDDTTTAANSGTVVIGGDGKRWKRLDMLEGKPWSPTWFGARFDVTFDDAPSWQSTINAAPPGTLIQAPAGRGMINDTIILDGKIVTIRGASESYWADTGFTPDFDYPVSTYAGTKLYSGPGLTGAMFKVMDEVTEDAGTGGRRNAVTFANLHLIGNMFAGPNPALVSDVATDTYGIQIVQGWGVKVIDVNITNFTSDGMIGGAGNVTTSDVCQFIRLNCAGNGGWGAQWNGADSWFLNCRFNLNSTGGALVGSSINTFQSCRFDLNVGPGARASGLQFNRFIDCVFDANDANGLHAGDGTTDIRNYIITGCTFANNGKNYKAFLSPPDQEFLQLRQRAGLWVFGGRGWVIANNTYADYEAVSKRQTYGLYLSDGWRDHRITNPVFSGNTIGTTNLRTKNIEGVYNVLEHGVEQNSVDCAPALQELIDSVTEGATLYFPEGNYFLLSSLTITKALRLLGQSVDDLESNKGSFIQASSALNGPCFIISDGGVVIERLNFFGSLLSASTAASGIEWTTGTGGRVDRCVLSSFRGPCIKVGVGANNVWIQNSVTINGETNGVLIQGNNCQVSGGEHRQHGQYGIYSLGASDTRISDAFVWDNGWDGIIIQDGQRAIVTGNTCRANLLSGIRLRSGSRHMAHNNQCYGNGLDTGATALNRAGIAVIEGDRLSVCHNHCGTNSGGIQQHGISFGSLLTSAMVLDNTFEGNAVSQYLWNATSQPGLDIDLSGSVELDFPSIAAGTPQELNVTLSGVLSGDAVMLGPPANWNRSLQFYGVCTAANTVTVVAYNPTGGAINPAAGDWQVCVSRRGGAASAAPPAPTLTLVVHNIFDNPNLLKEA